jgi:AraC family transcriptional regulator
MGATRTDVDGGEVRGTKAVIGPFEAQLIHFPPHHAMEAFDFDRDYLVVVLDGSLRKTFASTSWSLGRGSFATLPAGATHASAFGPAPVRVVAVRARSGVGDELGKLRLRHVHATGATALGLRLAGELRAQDSCWGLAAEGLALQLVALAGRVREWSPGPRRRSWIRDVRELLHERVPDQITLTELAEAVGVHPVHVARTFRREYGVTVAQYARSLRLDWAAQLLIAGECTLAAVAAEAGFADQSHFTRAFRDYAGVTPGRYRELLRREGPGAGARPRPVAP